MIDKTRIDGRDGGYTLIVTLILLAVLMVLGASAIKMANSEVEGAIGYQKREMLTSCARAARDYLLSNLRWGGSIPRSDPATGAFVGPAVRTEIKDPDGNAVLVLNDVGANFGHVPGVVPQIERVEMLHDETLGRGGTGPVSLSITNNIPGPGGTGGGLAARVTVLCSVPDPRGSALPPLRSHELEMIVRYGL